MKKIARRRSRAVGAALVLGALRPALADPDPSLSYDDPAMRYSAPDGWTKIDVPPSGGNQDRPTTRGSVRQGV